VRRSFCSENGFKPGLVNHGRSKESRQYTKKVVYRAKEYKRESWSVTWIKEEPRPDFQNCEADAKER